MNNPEPRARRTESDGSSVGQRLYASDLSALNERQRTIVWLIAQGHTNQQIGAEIDLERGLVAEEVEHLSRALGLQTRLQLAVVVRQHDAQAGSQRPGQEGHPASEGA